MPSIDPHFIVPKGSVPLLEWSEEVLNVRNPIGSEMEVSKYIWNERSDEMYRLRHPHGPLVTQTRE